MGWALGDQGVVDAGPPHQQQQPWEAADEGVLQPPSLCQQTPAPQTEQALKHPLGQL